MRPAPRTPRSVPQSVRKPTHRLRRSHREFVAALDCLRCGRKAAEGALNECAHVRMGTDGGMGLKPSDRYTVPLCPQCHRLAPDAQHTIGEAEFWSRVGVDPTDAAMRLWTVSGKHEDGQAVIFKVRQRIQLYAHRVIPT